MKYRLPPNCGALSHAGASVSIAADSSVELDASVVALLLPHGIAPLGDPAPIDQALVATMSTVDLTAALVARNVMIPAKANNPILRGLLRQALAKPTR